MSLKFSHGVAHNHILFYIFYRMQSCIIKYFSPVTNI